MRVVWKYQLNYGNTAVPMPTGAEIVHVGAQLNCVVIWALVDPLNEKERRDFRVHGTGHKDIGPNESYIGSVIDGAFVWHVFEVVA